MNPSIEPDLSFARLTGFQLRGVNFRGANLAGADLSGCSLRDADCSGANLSGANLQRAVFRRTLLRGANLSGANVSEALFRTADLTGAELAGAIGVEAAVDFPGGIRRPGRRERDIPLPEHGPVAKVDSLATRSNNLVVAFDPDVSPTQVVEALRALSNYYRATGGLGFEIDFESQLSEVAAESRV